MDNSPGERAEPDRVGVALAPGEGFCIALHAINTVQAQSAGAGFLAAALFGAGAIVVSVVGIRTRRPAASALDDVDGEPAP